MKYAASLVAVLAAACGTVSGSEPDAGPDAAADAASDGPPAAECSRKAETRTDPNTKQSWPEIWFCANDGGAPLYLDPNRGTPVATMDSEWSWFVCYRRGEVHAGGNDVWYYTQGDRPTPGQERRQNWGYMAASSLKAKGHPQPGVPECK